MLGQASSQRQAGWMLILAAITVVAAKMLFVSTSPRLAAPLPRAPQSATAVPVHAGTVAVPFGVLWDRVSFFESEFDGKAVRLFVTAQRNDASVYREACEKFARARARD